MLKILRVTSQQSVWLQLHQVQPADLTPQMAITPMLGQATLNSTWTCLKRFVKNFNLLSSFFNISESKCKPEADESAARAVESVELAQQKHFAQRVGHFLFHFVSTGLRVCGTEMLRSQ